tara:strand:+ start:1318 stop:1890 length:573 start_codon:yes stop_codon:yes gene_type:complete
MEEWKEIPGFEDYQASNKGKVKSIKFNKDKILKPSLNSSGYHQVALSLDGKSKTITVHKLVLISFKGIPKKGMEGCHNDGVRTNNDLSNLRWATRTENQHDRIAHGTDNSGIRSGTSKLTEDQVREILNIKKHFKMSNAKIGFLYGVDGSCVSDICTGKSYKSITRNYNEEIKETTHYPLCNNAQLTRPY